MSTPVAATATPTGAGARAAADTRLCGRRLAVARAIWLVLVTFVLTVFVAGIPIYVAQLQIVCTGAGCPEGTLSLEMVRGLGQVGISPRDYALYISGVIVATSLVWFGVAAVIAWRRSDDWMALFVALTLVVVGAFSVAGSVEPGDSVWQVPIHLLSTLELACFFLFFCLFPDGRPVPRWTIWIVVCAVALDVAGDIFPALDVLGWLWFVFAGILASAQVYRYRHASGAVQRQQTKWVVSSVGLVILVALGMFARTIIFAPSTGADALTDVVLAPVANVAILAFPLSIGVAVLRYRLWDIDPIVNRTLVYGGATVGVVGLYVLVVWYFGEFFRVRDNSFVSLLATGIVAVLFQPMRDRLQHAVNRLMYGERDNPYEVVSRLGRRLEATLAPDAVLPAVVETVRNALKLPYAAIALDRDGRLEIASESGRPTGDLIRLPLVYQSEAVGEMLLAPRTPGEEFGAADRRLLEDLARHVGVAVRAVRLTADLRRSNEHLRAAREQLVTAREEERRRLRRDLHDGLGPVLGGLTLKLDIAHRLTGRDPARAGALLLDLKAQAQSAIGDIRRLVHQLRPPALDELGLVGALREAAANYGGSDGHLRITVDAPDILPVLPAAVEVALYRIAQEAMTNVARHASARNCAVRLGHDPDEGVLTLEVRDDGVGLPEGRREGVGLASIRERAAELGGTCEIRRLGVRGTLVVARLPYAVADESPRRLHEQVPDVSTRIG